MNFFEKIKQNFSKLNIAQQLAIGVLIVSVPLVVALSVNAINNSLLALEASNSADTSSQEQIVSSVEESSSEESSSEESSSESEEEKEPVKIHLKLSSVEEDLEVQIVDEKGNKKKVQRKTK